MVLLLCNILFWLNLTNEVAFGAVVEPCTNAGVPNNARITPGCHGSRV